MRTSARCESNEHHPGLALTPSGVGGITSTLNAWDGALTSNAAPVLAGTNGGVDAYATGAAHLILDINGYFAP